MGRNTISRAVLVAAFSVIASAAAFAHHGTPLYYGSGTLTLKGTVTEFAFVNPHAQIYFDAKDESGTVKHWAAECVSPGKLARGGFNRDTLKPGDQITITIHPSKSGDPVGSFMKLVMADGTELPIRTAGGSE